MYRGVRYLHPLGVCLFNPNSVGKVWCVALDVESRLILTCYRALHTGYILTRCVPCV